MFYTKLKLYYLFKQKKVFPIFKNLFLFNLTSYYSLRNTPLIAILDDWVEVKEAALIKFTTQSLWCAFSATWMHVHGILAKVTRCKEIVNEIVFYKKLYTL